MTESTNIVDLAFERRARADESRLWLLYREAIFAYRQAGTRDNLVAMLQAETDWKVVFLKDLV